LLAGQTFLIPGRDLFEFDEDTGVEHFYVAISRDRVVPSLTTQGVKNVEKKKPAASRNPSREKKQEFSPGREKKAGNQLIQIGVRGSSDPQGKGIRTVVYDPGTKDPERYLYFSAPDGDDGRLTLIEFQLRHEK
jgi:hypothetical protein